VIAVICLFLQVFICSYHRLCSIKLFVCSGRVVLHSMLTAIEAHVFDSLAF
jgi:predicted membrane channel-forming protein YqfA (hemolysin III family)